MPFLSWPKLACAGLAVSLLVNAALPAAGAPTGQYLVYFGTFTGTNSKGIYVSRFDSNTGTLTAPALAAELVNPSFLAVAPDHRFLFAVNETDRFNGQPGGAITAFKLEAATGKLELLNRQPSGGAGPCHLVVDATGRYVLAANYNSGSVAVLPVRTNGFLGPPTAVIQHHGSSVNRERQAGPHAHCVALAPAGDRVFACDLGLDKVMIYRLNETNGTLATNAIPWAALKPGSGPRHLAFSPDGRHACVISEMASTLTAFDYDPASGALKEIQTVSTLPEDFHGTDTAAEVAFHPSGKFVYASNRGDDSLAVFAVDQSSGRLDCLEHQSTRGRTPRNFAIDPTGHYLLAANQNSDNLVLFRIDPQTGRLTWTGQTFPLGKPVCVVFVPLAAGAGN